MQFYTIHLPVKTYVKKFLQSQYGNPIFIDGKSIFSDIILSKLSSDLHSFLKATDLDTRLNRFTDSIDIRIPITYWYRLEKSFTQHTVVRINRYFENRFEESLHMHVDLQVRYASMERKAAIESFALENKLDIEVDITFEAMKKMEWRHRKEKEENLKKSLLGLSPANSLF